MLRFQTAIVSVLASLLVVPTFLGQGQIASLQDALTGTRRALEVLKGLEQRLHEEPAAALGLILSATETPGGDEVQRDQRLESLRNEVSLLQMELDAMQSPMLGADGAVQSALGARLPLEPLGRLGNPALPTAGITTGMDDSLRALLSEAPSARAVLRGESSPTRPGTSQPGASEASRGENAYSADPLRHGITCYRAGRYAEAYELLLPLDSATGLYWQARTLERLERLDDAVKVMERALAKGGDDVVKGEAVVKGDALKSDGVVKSDAGFDQRRTQTDLEFLRWKRDFVANLPSGTQPKSGKPPQRAEGGPK